MPPFAPADFLPAPVALEECHQQHEQGELGKEGACGVEYQKVDIADAVDEPEEHGHPDKPAWLEHPESDFAAHEYHDGDGRENRQPLDDFHFFGQG